ncbi:MAG: HAMP domain-containing histidine kinase, partial [Clostridia bacterium]|nr:HAMP domain-containing histidine kinase [Clostridia bacterium]
MVENVNYYKYLGEDYKDYIELWIHEIKIPIATSKMIIENNKNEVTKSIKEEIEKIENYIEQTLFYARSNTVEKDYYIKKTYLKEIVNESIKKNKNSLIQEKVILNIHDLALEVNTDSK